MIVGVFAHGWRGRFAAIAIQLSVVAFAFGLLQGGLWALTGALFPPILGIVFDYYAKFGKFLALVYPAAALSGGVVLMVCLAVPQWRLWCLAPTLLAAMAAALLMGERISQKAMCETAVAMGIKEFRRNSLRWSLANTPEEFQFDIHANAKLGDRWLGWSYREMNWYVIPERAEGNVVAPVFDCGAWMDQPRAS